MKKPCKGDRIGLNPELNRINILFAVLLISGEVFSQIPINGFCKYNSYKTAQNFSSIFSMNYNGDSYSDLLLFNPAKKDYQLLSGNINGFTIEAEQTFAEEISNISYVFNEQNLIEGFFYTSRKQMTAGIYNFASDGKAEILKSIKFNSYPDNISSADVDTDGIAEYLISGSAFSGLSIIYNEEGDLKERKIAANSSFTDAVFCDLSVDGVADIAAFNLISNSLVFFYNYGDGNFREVRSIPMKERIYDLHSVDINLDMFDDILYLYQGKINIIYGDFQSSYEEKRVIKTAYSPDSFVTGDFNKDGRIDIVYLSKKESAVSILFSKNDKEFYPEIIFFKKNGLEKIIPFYSRFITGIAALSSKGEVITVTNIPAISSGVNLFAGAEPKSIVNFDNENNGITDIAYMDRYTKSLKLFVRNNAGIPSIFYSFPLLEDHSEIAVDNTLPNEKLFVCYTKNKKLVELLGINFKQNKFTKKALYVPGNILSIKINRKSDEAFELLSAYEKNGKLGVFIYDHSDVRTITRNYENISSNIIDADFTSFSRPVLLYWKNRNDSLVFFKTENFSYSEKIFSIDLADKFYFQSFSGDIFNDNEPSAFTFIGDEKRKTAVLSKKSVGNVFVNDTPIKNISSKNKMKFFLGEIKINGMKKLMLYSPVQSRLYKIDFPNKGKKIIFDLLFDNLYAESFFIKNMNTRNYHIVYINPKENCISIKQISQ